MTVSHSSPARVVAIRRSVRTYYDPQAATLPDQYIRWNNAIIEYFAPRAQDGAPEEVLMCITPRSLAAAWAATEGEELSPDEAEEELKETVRSAYRWCVSGSSAKLRVFLQFDRRGGGLPQCAAFLALSVLAAYNMRSEGGTGSADYYQRLIELLNVNEHGGKPQDFDTSHFEDLWYFLSGWMHTSRRRVLAFPDPGAQRYIGFPLAHVPLRRLDVEKLPDFFLWARYDAHGTVEYDRMSDDLNRWGSRYFSRSGRAAVTDGRLLAVAEQAALELKAWDGANEDDSGRRSSLIEVQLESVRRRWQVSLLARCPDGFPDPFRHTKFELMSSDDGWYEPVLLGSDDGVLLEGGFQWAHSAAGARTFLRRIPRKAIVLIPDRHFPGLISRRGLPMRGEFAVLCEDSLLPDVQAYLNPICDTAPEVLRPPTIPQGWNLLRGTHVVRRPSHTPPELDGLEISSSVEITLRGGLRMGRNMCWLLDAPPQIQISGLDGEEVTLNGTTLGVDADGRLDTRELLNKEGTYFLQVGNAKPKKIEIASPDAVISPTPSEAEEISKSEPMLLLPSGEWILLGATPGDMARVHLDEWHSQSVSCKFDAIWAVSAESAREVVAIQVHPAPPPPILLSRTTALAVNAQTRAWSEAFYRVQSRRPRLASLYKMERTLALWNAYAEAAKQVKRRLSEKGKKR